MNLCICWNFFSPPSQSLLTYKPFLQLHQKSMCNSSLLIFSSAFPILSLNSFQHHLLTKHPIKQHMHYFCNQQRIRNNCIILFLSTTYKNLILLTLVLTAGLLIPDLIFQCWSCTRGSTNYFPVHHYTLPTTELRLSIKCWLHRTSQRNKPNFLFITVFKTRLDTRRKPSVSVRVIFRPGRGAREGEWMKALPGLLQKWQMSNLFRGSL